MFIAECPFASREQSQSIASVTPQIPGAVDPKRVHEQECEHLLWRPIRLGHFNECVDKTGFLGSSQQHQTASALLPVHFSGRWLFWGLLRPSAFRTRLTWLMLTCSPKLFSNS